MEANIELTAIDFETTGSVRGYTNEPWQIGIVSLTNTELYNQFDSLLYIGERPFNKYAPGRHAQLREELKQSPKLVELWPELSPRLVGRVLVAHNIGTERTMLKQVAPMHRFDCWIDTLALSRRVWKGLSSYALEDLIVVLQLKDKIDALCPGREPHDALYDAVACAILLQYIVSLSGWNKFTIRELSTIA
ncbi:MAG: hypothetical protein IJ444_07675 [Kiritimatiellae bacterium]|nr:hypothetical protein [Kiritimatiellia bacterium]